MKRLTVAAAALIPVTVMGVTQYPGVRVNAMALRDNGIANVEFVDSTGAAVTFGEGCSLSDRGIMVNPLQVSTFIAAYQARDAVRALNVVNGTSVDEATVMVVVDGCTSAGDPAGNDAAKVINIKLEPISTPSP